MSLDAAVATATLLADKPVFLSTWKTPDAYGSRFVGKKVAAVVISDDDGLRIPGEEALVTELTARGIVGVASYRIAPKEELRDAARAKPWFERQQIEGVVALRPVVADVVKTYTPAMWTSSDHQSVLGLLQLRLGRDLHAGVDLENHGGRGRIAGVQRTERRVALGRRHADERPEEPAVVHVGFVKATVEVMQEQGLAGGQPGNRE